MSPRVSDFMTPLVHRIEPRALLAEAKALMEEHGIRHLPVIDGEALVGILTMSDLYVLESMLSFDADRSTVGEAMSRDVFTVARDTPLGAVARGMAERQIGSAVVIEAEKPVGIFTATDGLRALAQILDTR